MWRLTCLPMGWSGSAYYFCKITHVFTNYIRRPMSPTLTSIPALRRPSRRYLRNTRRHGTRMLPYTDDLLFLAGSYQAAVLLRTHVDALLTRLGLQRNPKKGIWTPTQIGDHLGLTVDFERADSVPPWTSLTSSPSKPLLYSAQQHRPHDGYLRDSKWNSRARPTCSSSTSSSRPPVSFSSNSTTS
jgi:hypothetical protein